MSSFQHIINLLNEVWSFPLVILLVIVGLYLTIRTRGVQFRYLYYAHKLAFMRSDSISQGDISHFQALMTALAATIGIGSITGVATAIIMGGVGALLWMWMAALIGMATKYGEAILAVKYRIVDEKGEMCGGPMYYIERGMHWKWMGVVFAILGIVTSLGTGNAVQSNSVALAIADLFHINPIWSGIILMVVVGITLIGGIKSIGNVAGFLVPVMSGFYIIGGIIIIILRFEAVPQALIMIIKSAFCGQAAIGGMAGASVMMAIQMGVSRSIFSSEAGLGSSSIAAAAAKTDTPGRQALVSMCSVFITTGIVCTITGLVIIVSGVLGKVDSDGRVLDGSALALHAFDAIIPYGGLVVTVALIPFAYSTILGWAYYGEKCVEYLFGYRAIKWYFIIFTIVIFFGSVLEIQTIWGVSNMMNGLMAFPNLIALFALAGVISKETHSFTQIIKQERKQRAKNKSSV